MMMEGCFTFRISIGFVKWTRSVKEKNSGGLLYKCLRMMEWWI